MDSRRPFIAILRRWHVIRLAVLAGRNLAIAADGQRYIHWRSGRNSTLLNLGFPRSGPTAESPILVQTAWGAPNGEPALIEHLAGGTKVSVTWPESVSLYKRGEIDDGPRRLSR